MFKGTEMSLMFQYFVLLTNIFSERKSLWDKNCILSSIVCNQYRVRIKEEFFAINPMFCVSVFVLTVPPLVLKLSIQ